MRRVDSTKVKFDRHWVGEPNSGCWLWDGHTHSNGYGQFSLGHSKSAKKMGAHRASYLLHRGEIPGGMQVCHRCDVKCCVNPAHLFLGSGADNMRDAVRKGRMRGSENVPRGERNHKSKLSEASVREIRASREPAIVLAQRYGVSKVSLWKVRTWRMWKEIT